MTEPHAPQQSMAGVTRVADLHAGLGALAGLVTGAYSLQDVLTQVAVAAGRAIPGADGVGAMLLHWDERPNRVETLGASEPFVSEIDAIQYELLDEGPCVTAALERAPVRAGSLDGDGRWPRFGPRVARLGVHSALSVPMQLPDACVVGPITAQSRARDA